MASFKDREGREWSLTIPIGALKPLRELGFELGRIMQQPERIGELLLADPEKLVAALWLLIEKQADKLGVSPEQFAWAIDGSTLEQAIEAVIGAAIDFFPRSRVAAKMRGRLTAALEQADRDILTAMDSSATAGSSPGSPESPTPAP